MGAQLNAVPSTDQLYEYRGVLGTDEDAPPRFLPYHQGDVFSNVDLPGLPDCDHALLFLHPCTMRRGSQLASEVTVIGVKIKSAKKIMTGPEYWERHWSKSFGVMPLPDMYGDGGGTHVAEFMKMATVPSNALVRDRRVATLSAEGRLHLLQRAFYHFSRAVIPLGDLRASMRPVEREIELQTDWVESCCDQQGSLADEVIAEVELAFDAFLTTDNRRDSLQNGESEFSVARAVKKEIEMRYGGQS
ncbi:hypothetical protein ABZ753_06110 [Streptomyces griseoincarnatus]